MKSFVVIGGGPAGMVAALEAAKRGLNVTLIEKNEKLGKKLYITGKGRCNLTNDCSEEEFLQNISTNSVFMYSAIYGFNSKALMEYFEKMSIRLKVERGNRVFPVSEKSSDIIKALEKELRSHNVQIRLHTEALSIESEDGAVKGITLKSGEFIEADAVLIATGGLSYPVTGSTGDGYKFAESFGHKIKPLYPSLVPLKSNERWIPLLQGLSLKNVELKLFVKDKQVYTGFGEMLFTHEGISGPLILTASRFLAGKEKEKCKISIDLKPAMDIKELDKRILKDFSEAKNKSFKNSLDNLFPQKLIPIMVMLSGIDGDKKVNEITKEERKDLLEHIKNFEIKISENAGFNQAVITCGGVSTKEIDPGTMESRLIKGLYFAGEVIDVDGFTGGFNLQVAFSTGYLCGNSV